MKYIFSWQLKKPFILLLLLSIFWGSRLEAQHFKILWIGNSFSIMGPYNVPQYLTNMVVSDGNTITIDVTQVIGGSQLIQRVGAGVFAAQTATAITSDMWDYVVLQEQSQKPSWLNMAQVNSEFFQPCRTLNQQIKAHNPCANVLFYMTWGYPNGDQMNVPNDTYAGMQQRLYNGYMSIADELNEPVSPVGWAFRRALQLNPSFNFWSDPTHQNFAGAYLSACVFFARLYNKSPVGLWFPPEISATDALFLQQVAAEVVLDDMELWNHNTRAQFTPFNPASNSPICAGQNLQLTANGPANLTYHWTGPNTFAATGATVTRNNIAAGDMGDYIVRGVDANGCKSEVERVRVQVLSNAAINEPSIVCVGDSIRLSATAVPNANYLWSGPGGFAQTVSGNHHLKIPNATLAMGGIYSLQVTLPGCTTNLATATVQVVNTLPPPQVTTPITVVQNATLTLSASMGNTQPVYEWSGPNGFSATGNPVQRPNFTNLDSGLYTVVAKLGNCQSPPVTIQVNLSAYCMEIAQTSHNGPVCFGGTYQVAVTAIPNASYTWAPPGIPPATFNNNTVNFNFISTLGIGVWSVTAILGGCTSNVLTFPVNVIFPPSQPVISSNSPVCIGQNLTLTAHNPGQDTAYFWSGPANFSGTGSQVNRPNTTAAMAGVYTLIAVYGGCSSAVATTQVNVVELPSPLTISGTTQICGNNTPLVLTSNAPTSAQFLWSGPNGFSSTQPVVNTSNTSSASAGNYSLQVSASGCPPVTQTITVTFNNLPTVPGPAINPVTPVCAGQTLTLSAPQPPPPVPPNASIVWMGPDNFVAQGLSVSRPAMQTQWAGLYSAAITLNGCTSAVETAEVNLLPTPQLSVVNNTSPVCAGGTLNINVTNIPGAVYQWFVPNVGFVSQVTGPNIMVQGQNTTSQLSGLWSVTAIANGCTSNLLEIPVSIGAQAPPTPQTPEVIALCAGETLNLTVNNFGNVGYRWVGPGNYIAIGPTQTRPNLAQSDFGTYSVVAFVNGCTSLMATTKVEQNTLAAPSVPASVSICLGDNLNITATAPSGAVFIWNGPNGFSFTGATVNKTNVTTNDFGVYSVTAILNGCTSSIATTNVTLGASAPPNLPATYTACNGASLTITADLLAGAAYLWQGPNNFTQTGAELMIPNFSAANQGVYTLIRIVNGCSSLPAITNITIGVPQGPSVLSPVESCPGGSAALKVNNPVAGSTYLWSGPNNFQAQGDIVNMTNLSAGQAGVYSVVSVQNGCTSAVSTALLNISGAIPLQLISSNSPICQNQKFKFEVTYHPGASYQWWYAGFMQVTDTNVIDLPAPVPIAGSIWVKAQVGACVSDSLSIPMQANPIPALTLGLDTLKICEGQNILATPSSSVPGSTFEWLGPNNFTQTAMSLNMPATQSANGAWSVTALGPAPTHCASTPVNFQTVVWAKPAKPNLPDSAFVCQGETVNWNLSNTEPQTTYHWSGPNNFSSTGATATIPSVSPAEVGEYKVYAMRNGCVSDTAKVHLAISAQIPAPAIGGSTTVCQGGELNLNIIGGTLNTYIWSGPNNFSLTGSSLTISSINLVDAGAYSVYGFTGQCTSSAANVTVIVNPLPSVPVVNNVSVCPGAAATLAISNPVAGNTYTWQDAQNNAYSGTQITLNNITQTQQVQAATIAQGCTSAFATASIQLLTTPAPPTPMPLNAVCQGDTITLSAIPPPNSVLWWTGPNNFSSQSFAVVINGVNPSQAGVYSVVAIATGCTSQVASLNVTITPLPAAPQLSSISPVCSGSNLTITALSPTGALFIWNGPNNYNAQGANVAFNDITTAQAGIYQVRAIQNGCTSQASNINVTVNPLPAAPQVEPTTICSGKTLNLLASTPVGATFIWSGPGGYSATGNPAIRPSMQTAWAGIYSAQSVVNGCISEVTPVPVSVLETPQTPIIATQGNRCLGSPFELMVQTPQPGEDYYWQGVNAITGTTSTLSLPELQLSNQGVYSLVAIANNCTSNLATYNLIATPLPVITNIAGNTELCAGQTLTLTATGTPGAVYFWSGPSGFSGTENPMRRPAAIADWTGNYEVFAVASGCTSAQTVVPVIIHPIPTAPTASYQEPACTGQDLILTATSGDPNVSFVWYGPNGYSAVSSQNNTIRAGISERAAGVYSVVAKLGNCTSSVGIVKVNVIETPGRPTITGKATYCQGDTIKLSGSGHFNASLHWSGPDNFSAIGNFIQIPNSMPSNAGVYSLVAQRNGCYSSPAQLTVSILPLPAAPTIQVPPIICEGGVLLLTANAPGAETYHWAGPGGFMNNGNASRIRIEPAALASAGAYTLYVVQNGCTSATVNTVVNITPLPSAPAVQSSSPVCTGSVLQLTATQVAPGGTVNWTGPNNFNAQGQTASLFINQSAQAGLYQAYTVAGGCTSGITTFPVRIITTPAAPSAASQSMSSVCTGGNLQLSVIENRGERYYWQGPQGFEAWGSSIQRENASANFAGVYTAIAIVEGCTSLPLTRNISVTPALSKPEIDGNLLLCSEGSLTLNVTNPEAGAVYEWAGPDNFSQIGNSLMRAPIQTQHGGIYSVRARKAGCLSEVAFVEVNIIRTPPQPIIRNNGPICQGQPLYFFTENPILEAAYIWNGPNGYSGFEANPLFSNPTPQHSGVYSLQMVIGNCTSSVATMPVVVNSKPNRPVTGAPITACEGQNVTLEAAGEPGVQYRWSGPRSWVASVQKPTLTNVSSLRSGVYSVVAVSGNCTSDFATQTLNISPRPAMPQVQTNSPVCAGQNISMLAVAQAGSSFIWNGPGGFNANGAVVNLLNVSASQAGIYSVVAVVNTCSSIAANVLISISPTPIIAGLSNNGPICGGATLQLSQEPQIGVVYFWAGPAGFSSTLPNPSIANASPSNAGVYTLVATLGNCSSTATTNALVSPAAPSRVTATATTPVCEGNTIQFNTQDYPGATYNWSGPNGFNSTQKSPTIPAANLSNSGIYSLVVGSGNCSSPVATVQVIVNPAPIGATATHNGPLCEGMPLQLTGSLHSGAQYIWQGPDGFNASGREVTVSRPVEGIYTLTVIQGNCRSTVTTNFLTISPLPAVPKAGANPSCEGGVLEFFASSTPGAQFYWTGPSGFTSKEANPWRANVSLAEAGSYTVVAIIGACTSLPAFVNAQVQPFLVSPSIQSNAPLCEGQTLELKAPYLEGASYWWQGPGGYTSPAAEAVVFNPLPGDYSLTIRLGRCEAIVPPISVEIYPLPATPQLLPTAQVCSGSELTLSVVNPVPGAAYLWEGPADFSAETANGTLIRSAVNSANAGGYFVRAIQNGCTSSAALTRVVVNAAPSDIRVASNGPVCAGSSLQLTASFMPGVTYMWQGPGNYMNFRNTALLPEVNTGAAGVYTLTATLNGCSTVQTLPVEVRNCRKGNEVQEPTISIYPNPSSGQLLLSYEGSANERIDLQIFDSQGRIIFRDNWLQEEASAIYRQDFNALPSGLYHVQIGNGVWLRALPWLKH